MLSEAQLSVIESCCCSWIVNCFYARFWITRSWFTMERGFSPSTVQSRSAFGPNKSSVSTMDYLRIMTFSFIRLKISDCGSTFLHVISRFTRSMMSSGTKVSKFCINSVPFRPIRTSLFVNVPGRGFIYIFLRNFSALILRSSSWSLVSKKAIKSWTLLSMKTFGVPASWSRLKNATSYTIALSCSNFWSPAEKRYWSPDSSWSG